MRDDVLEDELRNRLPSMEETLRKWFDSLRPAECLRLIEMMDGQIQHLENQPGQGIVRR